MAPVRSYTNWNSRTTDEKSQRVNDELKETNKKRSKRIKMIIQLVLVIIIALFLFFFPVNFIRNKTAQFMIVAFKIIIISGLTISQIRTNPIASLATVTFIGFGIWFCSINISQNTLLKMVTGTKWEFQYIFLVAVCCMIAIWLCLSLWGTKKYRNKKTRDKIKFVICVCIEYVVILIVVINVYANLYMAYHDNMYFMLQTNLFETQGENVSSHRKRIEKKIDGKRWIINGNYDERDEEKLCPLNILIQDEEGNSSIIEPDLNIALDEDKIGTANSETYIYFSFGSFFSSGYGDIYPISTITRNWAVQEMIISHILMILLIPIMITSIQEFIQKNEVKLEE